MIKCLNGIRTFLFLLIFGAHFKYVIMASEQGRKLFEFFNVGRFAILFFILLSGFCMALGYSDKFNSISKESVKSYIEKRLIKLYPLYFLSGLVGTICIYLPQSIHWLKMFLFIYVPMLTPWLNVDTGSNPAGWYIGMIVFCYLLTPFTLNLFNKNNNKKFHITFCLINYLILICFSLFLVFINDVNNDFFFRFPIIRIFEYFITLNIGYLFVKTFKDKFNLSFLDNYITKSLIDLAFILSFLNVMYVLPNNLLYRHLIGIPLICIFLIYICIEKRSFLYDILNSKLVNFVGNISFECYLIHLLVLKFMSSYSAQKINTFSDIVLLYFTLLGITIGISYLYKNIELLIKRRYLK